MKVVKSTIFSINVPDEMEVTNPLEFMVVLNYSETNGTIDKPRIVLSFNKIKNYNDLVGEDLLSKFRKSVVESRFKAEVKSFEVLTKNECTMYVVHSYTKKIGRAHV